MLRFDNLFSPEELKTSLSEDASPNVALAPKALKTIDSNQPVRRRKKQMHANKKDAERKTERLSHELKHGRGMKIQKTYKSTIPQEFNFMTTKRSRKSAESGGPRASDVTVRRTVRRPNKRTPTVPKSPVFRTKSRVRPSTAPAKKSSPKPKLFKPHKFVPTIPISPKLTKHRKKESQKKS